MHPVTAPSEHRPRAPSERGSRAGNARGGFPCGLAVRCCAAMDLAFSPEHTKFREEVRAFIAEALPPHLRPKAEVDAHFEHGEIMEWHRILYRKGWAAP